MAWHAKPVGSYSISSVEGTENILMIASVFRGANIGATDEALTGIITNCYWESGLNPWRWQYDDLYNTSLGYGLFQFSPAQGEAWSQGYIGNYIFGYNNFIQPMGEDTINYFNPYYALQGYSPFYTTDPSTPPNATPNDGNCQTLVLLHDSDYANIAGGGRAIGLQKWNRYLTREYWELYPEVQNELVRIRNQYGFAGSLYWISPNPDPSTATKDFLHIDNIYDATLAFLGGYEGPLVPNVADRYSTAAQIYEILTGNPPPPSPTNKKKGMPLYMMIRYL